MPSNRTNAQYEIGQPMGSLGTDGPCVWADPKRGGYHTGATVHPVLKSGAAGKTGTAPAGSNSTTKTPPHTNAASSCKSALPNPTKSSSSEAWHRTHHCSRRTKYAIAFGLSKTATAVKGLPNEPPASEQLPDAPIVQQDTSA